MTTVLEGEVRVYSDYDWFYVTVGGEDVAATVEDVAEEASRDWIKVPERFRSSDGSVEHENEYLTPVGLRVRITIEVLGAAGKEA